MVAFGFLPQSFWKWQGSTDHSFAQKIELYALSGGGDAKSLQFSLAPGS